MTNPAPYDSTAGGSQPPRDPWAPPSADETAPPPAQHSPYGAPTTDEAPASATAGPQLGQAPGQAPGSGYRPAAPAPGTDLGADLGATLTFAWRGLLKGIVPFLVSGLIYGVVWGLILGGTIVGAVGYLFSATRDTGPGAELPPGVMLTYIGIVLLGSLLTMPLMWLWMSGSMRAAQELAEQRTPTIGQALIGPGRVILTAVLVSVVCGIGFLLLYLPGLVAAVLLMFAIPAAMRGASPIAAMKESVSLVTKNLGISIVAMLILGAISSIVGMFLVTVIVLIPFCALGQFALYERLNGRELPSLQ